MKFRLMRDEKPNGDVFFHVQYMDNIGGWRVVEGTTVLNDHARARTLFEDLRMPRLLGPQVIAERDTDEAGGGT